MKLVVKVLGLREADMHRLDMHPRDIAVRVVESLLCEGFNELVELLVGII